MEHVTTLHVGAALVVETLHLIDQLKTKIRIHLAAVQEQRQLHPHGKAHTISGEELDYMYELCNKIRSSGEAINFTTVSCTVDLLEKMFKKLRTPVQYRRTDILSDLLSAIEHLEQAIK